MSKFGILQVADVVFFDMETKKPAILFDSLKVSTIENESESAEARGGKGNPIRVSWSYGRTATLALEDALLSMESLSTLSGNAVEEATVAYGREMVTVGTDGSVTLSETPVEGTVTVFANNDGIIGDEVQPVSATAEKITGLNAGDKVMVFYEYTAPEGSKRIRFSADKFPGTYKVIGDTVVRDESTGRDKAMQFVIHKAQLQSNFSITLDAENVSTFDFNLNVMKDNDSNDLYELIKLA